MDLGKFDRRPIVIAVAGSNGAGKTTFYHSHLASAGLRFVNADVLAAEVGMAPYQAAAAAAAIRRAMVKRGESFVFETVFSDPVGDKVGFLEEAARDGYEVLLCYIGLASVDQSIERVAMRVSKGGHDIPTEKLQSRFPRTLNNLRKATARLPNILVYDNSELATPFRQVAAFENGQLTYLQAPVPEWLRDMLP